MVEGNTAWPIHHGVSQYHPTGIMFKWATITADLLSDTLFETFSEGRYSMVHIDLRSCIWRRHFTVRCPVHSEETILYCVSAAWRYWIPEVPAPSRRPIGSRIATTCKSFSSRFIRAEIILLDRTAHNDERRPPPTGVFSWRNPVLKSTSLRGIASTMVSLKLAWRPPMLQSTTNALPQMVTDPLGQKRQRMVCI